MYRSVLSLLLIALLLCGCAATSSSSSSNAASNVTTQVDSSAELDAEATPSFTDSDAAADANDDLDRQTPASPSCGRDPDGDRYKVRDCELGDLTTGNWSSVSCKYTTPFDSSADDCARRYPTDTTGTEATPLGYAVHVASSGTIDLMTDEGLSYGNVMSLFIMLRDKDEIDRVIERHGHAAIEKALSAWQPVYARYHNGDRGVCVRIVDDSLMADEGKDMGYYDSQDGAPIVMQQCTQH